MMLVNFELPSISQATYSGQLLSVRCGLCVVRCAWGVEPGSLPPGRRCICNLCFCEEKDIRLSVRRW
jgi:hypothetical protein